jgi:8-oxo-dGTP diphosphatase
VKEYVAGFLICEEDETVALVVKNKPEWQAGLWNAIGGKIEAGETPLAAMIREFQEETGYVTSDWTGSWTRYAVLNGYSPTSEQFCVHFFYRFTAVPLTQVVTTTTDEKIIVVPWQLITPKTSMANLRWLLLMALDIKSDSADSFDITEQYKPLNSTTTKRRSKNA